MGKKKTQSFGNEFFNPRVFPKHYGLFLTGSVLLWFSVNIGLILIFSVVYYYYDNGHKSRFDGLKDGKRHYYEYIYLAGMVGTLVGFGDVVAKRDPVTKLLVISHVILALLCNYIILSFKELKLADDPTGTYDFTTQ